MRHFHNTIYISHLDANKVNGNDGPLQGGQTGFIQRFSHHHFGCHTDEVHTDGFGHKREGARCPQVTFNHLKGKTAVKRQTKLITTWTKLLQLDARFLKSTLFPPVICNLKVISSWRWTAFDATKYENYHLSFSLTLRKYYLPWHHCL